MVVFRKPIFWVLVILASLPLLIEVQVLLIFRRAESELKRQEAKVDQDISSLRSRLRMAEASARTFGLHRRTLELLRSWATVPPQEEPLKIWKEVHPSLEAACWELTHMNDPGVFYPYERGNSQSSLLVWVSWADLRLSKPEDVLLSLGFVHEFARGAGLWSHHRDDEMVLLGVWRAQLEARKFPASELAMVADGLDHLWDARPALTDEFSASYAIKARTLILAIRDPHGQGADGAYYLKPGWKALYSNKVEVVRALRELEEDLRVLPTVEQSPIWERAKAYERLQREERRFFEEQDARRGSELFALEALTQMQWMLARTATALAWYEAEKGKPPESLEVLVPRYLSKVPLCPQSGRPFLYRPGELSSMDTPDGLLSPEARQQRAWIIR
jgi:hypothetical protein